MTDRGGGDLGDGVDGEEASRSDGRDDAVWVESLIAPHYGKTYRLDPDHAVKEAARRAAAASAQPIVDDVIAQVESPNGSPPS